jgi:pimeloyl-ACP methyl ester carboxylesterase
MPKIIAPNFSEFNIAERVFTTHSGLEVPFKTIEKNRQFANETDSIASNRIVHFYPGLGEGVLNGASGINTFQNLGLDALAVIVRFGAVDTSPYNIQAILEELPLSLALQCEDEKGITPDMSGRSTGAYIGLKAVASAPEIYKSFTGVSTIGLNNTAFGETSFSKLGRLFSRFAVQNNLKQNQLRPSSIPAATEIIKAAFEDAKKSRLVPQLLYGLSNSLLEDLDHLSKLEVPTGIFVPERDPLVSISEVRTNLEELNLGHLLHEIQGSHASTHSVDGIKQFEPVAKFILGIS